MKICICSYIPCACALYAMLPCVFNLIKIHSIDQKTEFSKAGVMSVRGYKERGNQKNGSTESQHEHLVGKQSDDSAGNHGSGRSGFFFL